MPACLSILFWILRLKTRLRDLVLRRLSSGASASLGLSAREGDEDCLSIEMECGESIAAQSVFVGMAALRSFSLREAWDV